jgi:hypothetical protein
MGIVLALLSTLLSLLLYPIAMIITLFVNLYKKRWKLAWTKLDRQFLSIATSIDASGNVVCKDLFNLVLKQKRGYDFGKRKETISSVLGKNQRDKTLKPAGKTLAFLLDQIQQNHCLNSIDNLV